MKSKDGNSVAGADQFEERLDRAAEFFAELFMAQIDYESAKIASDSKSMKNALCVNTETPI